MYRLVVFVVYFIWEYIHFDCVLKLALINDFCTLYLWFEWRFRCLRFLSFIHVTNPEKLRFVWFWFFVRSIFTAFFFSLSPAYKHRHAINVILIFKSVLLFNGKHLTLCIWRGIYIVFKHINRQVSSMAYLYLYLWNQSIRN